ncbi:MAG TPA: SpoIIE family protein phosphatase [Gemmataceae bacterium]|jgi:sigma-B regulation protein RsbU (phosphoserine phosphatase)|nr:SpoIIE family protein phosphatase [Gemmataceae bacterium]
MKSLFDSQYDGDWRKRLDLIVEMMRDMSVQTDPQEMVRAYAERVRRLLPSDRVMSLSRRDLARPKFRITRSSTWQETINPWKDRDRLPQFEGGLLADLIYGNEPVIIDNLDVPANDPAVEYLANHRSLLAIPLFDQGVALNMTVRLRKAPSAFDPEQLPELVWMSNLFGRATSNLVLSEQLQQAYQALDRELKSVGEIQRSLLPAQLPTIPNMDVAAYYQPSQRAGGDYYDFFPLPEDKWGIFIADVSGHGTPAAVLMAITHCMAHTYPGPPMPPGAILQYLNQRLAKLYTGDNGTFITAFYAIYDPRNRNLIYSSAGHNPPRLKRCQDGTLLALDQAGGLALGILPDAKFQEATQALERGDQIIFYTDGITEARNPAGEMFGTERLDQAMENCSLQATALLEWVLNAVDSFTQGQAADDDRTVIVARIS